MYLPRFFKDLNRYQRLNAGQKVAWSDLYPCLLDWTVNTPFDAHYFYQGAWLGRKLKTVNTKNHVDIASSVLTISVLSAFVDTVFVDYRPLKANLAGLKSIPGDILNLPFDAGSQPSVSCLHVIEHIGLGRYGDPLNPMGSINAALELQRILSVGGNLYLALPIGRERICFNAHRVHSPNTVLGLFPQLRLVDFSFVDDGGQFHPEANIESAQALEYGCGLYHFQKA
ncbi:DUF268 domain-containing protein [Polynucleobacter paneuropaeus]|nr:DUF268 domain-containing protein [Polynucleobacter paneuropaeus]